MSRKVKKGGRATLVVTALAAVGTGMNLHLCMAWIPKTLYVCPLISHHISLSLSLSPSLSTNIVAFAFPFWYGKIKMSQDPSKQQFSNINSHRRVTAPSTDQFETSGSIQLQQRQPRRRRTTSTLMSVDSVLDKKKATKNGDQ
jgi:hypothetical protein